MRLVQVWFRCDVEGCEAQEEMLVPMRGVDEGRFHSLGPSSAVAAIAELPPRWGDKPNREKLPKDSKYRIVGCYGHEQFCPDHVKQ